MKKHILVLLLILSQIAQAQTILEDQFHFNFLALNPAMAGARETFSLNAMLGNQFNGSIRPQQIYQLFSTDGAIQQGRGGLALQAYNSNIIGFNNSGVKMAYAYRKKFGELFTLGVGADAGFIYQPTIITGLGLKQMYPYAGLGGLLTADRFFLGLSKPVLFINSEGLYNTKKPFYTQLGASFGDYERTMLNLSALIETNKSIGNNFYLNAKAWFNQKFGLGISYRSQEVSNVRTGKIVPMAELQVSEAIRLGLSYDPKPATYQTTASQGNFKQNGILQLYFRYEGRQDSRSTNRLKFY
ncbi:PorP/SprF family type IX secretion system membrane protein [Emticicia sp. SJ17W-69]|uniref:PorP/SprF family type IX secretion system membrane protein n=1 Tax=Emticicia sp. SJ17W-69 TaxID=3421657 RepID=UPI003EC0009E